MAKSNDSINDTIEMMLRDCLRYAELAANPKPFSAVAKDALRGESYFRGSFRRVLQEDPNAYASNANRNFLHKWSLILGLYARQFAEDRSEIDPVAVGRAIERVINEACEMRLTGTWCDFNGGED